MGGATTARDNRRYRTKLEVLRDLLEAASRERRKTRIIGMANLNQESFQRYAGLAISSGLLQVSNRSYALTPSAKEWLRAVDGVLRKGSEVSVAVAGLSRLTRRPAYGQIPDAVDTGEITRQLVARLAWSEIGVERPVAAGLNRSTVTAPRAGAGPTREGDGRNAPARSLLPSGSGRRSR